MSDKITVLVVEPRKPCRVQEIPNTLEAMSQVVGGRIESFSYQREAIICNEEGKLLGLPLNRPLYDGRGTQIDMLRGTFFIAGVDGEHFTSLTDDQLRHFKELYDRAVVPNDERPEIQDDEMPYFAIACNLVFSFSGEEQVPDETKTAFAGHVSEVFGSDTTLAENTVGDLTITSRDRCVEVQYTFASRSKDAFGAEAFSEQCVRRVQGQLEEYGYKLEAVQCIAEQLEEDLAYSNQPPQDRSSHEKKKKGNSHER